MSFRVANSARLYAKRENRAYKEAEHSSSSFLARLLCVRQFSTIEVQIFKWNTYIARIKYLVSKNRFFFRMLTFLFQT